MHAYYDPFIFLLLHVDRNVLYIFFRFSLHLKCYSYVHKVYTVYALRVVWIFFNGNLCCRCLLEGNRFWSVHIFFFWVFGWIDEVCFAHKLSHKIYEPGKTKINFIPESSTIKYHLNYHLITKMLDCWMSKRFIKRNRESKKSGTSKLSKPEKLKELMINKRLLLVFKQI